MRVWRPNTKHTKHMAEDGGAAEMELEMLQEIFRNDLVVAERTRGRTMTLEVRPEVREEEQFVKLTLQVALSATYPAQPAAATLINPRGLTGDEVKRKVKERQTVRQ